MQLISKLPELLNHSSRAVTRRQTRLQRIKGVLIKNALDKHFPNDVLMPQLPPLPPLTLPKRVARKNSQQQAKMNDQAYMMFSDLVKNSISTATQVC